MEEVNNCTSRWAELTYVGLGVASILKKQVMDIDLVITNKVLLQANSIKNSDKITNWKKAKGASFTEHKNIFEQAMAGNPCKERRIAMTGKAIFAFGFQFWFYLTNFWFSLLQGCIFFPKIEFLKKQYFKVLSFLRITMDCFFFI